MVDQPRIQKAVKEMLLAIGEDPDREGLKDTPARVARAMSELMGGYDMDVGTLLERRFSTDGYDQVVVLKDIQYWSMCEHHILPFHGCVDVAYIPGDKVLGVSKLARIVEAFARRLQIQERMTRQVAQSIMDSGAKAVAVVVRGQHLCMTARGVKQPSSTMVTSDMMGLFRDDGKARAEVLSLMHKE